MLKIDVHNQQGQVVGQADLDPKIFDIKPQRGLIEQAIVTIMANRRQVTAHTKTRADVRGGGRKPWRQKGTGRARHGSIRSPIWVGGGVAHGPRKNRNFTLKMNTTARRKALFMSLTDKFQSQRLTVIDKLELAKPKTKEFAAILKVLPHQKKNLVVLPTTNATLVQSGRNIPGLTFIRADSLNTYDVVGHGQIILLQGALPVISQTFAK